MEHSNYAGFWMRFVAYIIDNVIITTLQSVMIMPIFVMLGFGFETTQGFDFDAMFNAMFEEDIIGMIGVFVSVMSTAMTTLFVILTLYYSLMESSKYQATVGKMMLGLKVTDMNGEKLDFVKALLRQFGKIVSRIIFMIGYIMAGFTEKKQALHDMIAGALVVKK